MSLQLEEPPSARATWTRKHLLGLEDLSGEEITTVLDAAEDFVEVSRHHDRKRTDLKGRVVVNLFFEPSTRTRTSFGLAARRLSADTVDFTAGGSSVSKGETLADTARNLDLMKTRAWFDFPLLLNDDRIAKVVFQKSPEGEANSVCAAASPFSAVMSRKCKRQGSDA